MNARVLIQRPKLVVVGNGMAGMRTVEELLKIAPDLYDITVFGAEPHPNYNRILLSPVLAGEQTLSEIVLNQREWYAEHDIALHLGRSVTRIDRRARVVQAEDGTAAPYDRLLLATGSSPFILPVPGSDLPGVVAYRDIADTNAMIDAAATATSDSARGRCSITMWRARRNNDSLITRASANWSDNERAQAGFRSSKFSITRACPQPSSRFRLLNFSYRSLYLAGPMRTVSTSPCELFRIVSASVRIRASEPIRLLSTTPASRSLRAIPWSV